MCFTSLTPQSTSCFGKFYKNVYFHSHYRKEKRKCFFFCIYILHHFPFNYPTTYYFALMYTKLRCSVVWQRWPHYSGRLLKASERVSTRMKSQYCQGSLRLSAPFFALSMPLQRSAGSAWIVIMAPNRIQEHPNDGTWEPGRVELNGCQTLKAPQHVNKPTKAGCVHF